MLRFMQPKTEELLYFLLWSAEMLVRPTFRNITESFEEWAYRNGLLRQLRRLEQLQFLERDPSRPRDRFYRLTEQGRLHALGGRDPETQWSRTWDRIWRLVLFDIPLAENPRRNHLRQYLRGRGFGCLQGSVWITPEPLTRECEILAGGQINPASLILLEGRPCGEESDMDLVAAAWDFKAINSNYARCLIVLEQLPSISLSDPRGAVALEEWAREEQRVWLNAVTADPLLPQPLLPPTYLGRRAWQRRVEVLESARRKLSDFKGLSE